MSEQSDPKRREEGYYHVRLHDKWEIMQWFNDHWWVMYTEEYLGQQQINKLEIDETPIIRGDAKSKRIEQLETENKAYALAQEGNLAKLDELNSRLDKDIDYQEAKQRIQQLEADILDRDQVIIKQLGTISDLNGIIHQLNWSND